MLADKLSHWDSITCLVLLYYVCVHSIMLNRLNNKNIWVDIATCKRTYDTILNILLTFSWFSVFHLFFNTITND